MRSSQFDAMYATVEDLAKDLENEQSSGKFSRNISQIAIDLSEFKKLHNFSFKSKKNPEHPSHDDVYLQTIELFEKDILSYDTDECQGYKDAEKRIREKKVPRYCELFEENI